VAGYWTQQLTLLVLLASVTRFRPRFFWSRSLAREMLTYGWTFSSVQWTWQLRELVSPLIVGHFAGATAVGYVALTARLVDALSFMKSVAWRLSISVLAPLQHDRQRLVGAVGEGMRLQALALGPILVAFGLAAPIVTRALFGDRWTFVAQLYPYIALSYFTNAIFLLHTSALCLVRRPSRPVIFGLVHLTLFAGSALLFVPRLGVVGYGWAEVAALSSYAVLHAYMVREIGAPAYGLAGLWWLASAVALFWQQLGWWAALAPVVALAWPGTTRELRRYAVNFAGLIHAR
jgi:PST family polysaccharide transporter